MTDYKLIGKRIKEIRLRCSITQEKLAEGSNVSVPYISYIESGTKKPSLDVLIRIANVLEVTVDEILVGNIFYKPTDYRHDFDELLEICTQNEKRIILKMS
ncbi:MAG: helix-turn-helix transcriptional regulator, partial [Eubacterium sp.]|nr:helix-turn-helix transcriptional regulator [Eubacterium sp.]